MIHYLKGDATQPVGEGNKFIVHICNDIGGWGRGFVMAISRRWQTPEMKYRNWFRRMDDFALGNIQLVEVEPSLSIVNMIGQHKIRKSKDGQPPIRYDAVRSCLEKVNIEVQSKNASVHMPRIGCGLAGGTWDEIEPIIDETLIQNGAEVYVF